MPIPRSTRAAVIRRLWVSEAGPVACAIVALWGKQLYFGLSVQSIWLQESLWSWSQEHLTMFSATLAGAALLTAWTLLLPRSLRYWALLLVDACVTTLILADHISIYFYGDVVSILNISSMSMMTAVGSSVARHLEWSDTLYYVDILAGLLLAAVYFGLLRRVSPASMAYRMRGFGVLCSIGVILALPAVRTVRDNTDGAYAYSALQRESCAVLGVIPYHVLEAVLHTRSQAPLRPADRQRVRSYLERRAAEPSRASPLFAAAKSANVILISAESLQAFPIGLVVSGQEIAPRLARFAGESLRFTDFYDQTYLGTTSDAELSVLEALHPAPVGFAAYLFDTNHYRGLPFVLSVNGYTTISAVAAPADFWNMSRMHPQHGFTRTFFEDSFRVSERVGPWLADVPFFEQAESSLLLQKAPFFAFLLSSSNHYPYQLPRGYRVLKLGALEGTRLGDYLHSVHYFDEAFGHFLDQLHADGVLERTIVAVYGDHQAFLGDDSSVARLLGFAVDSELDYFLTRKKVPFLVRLPNGEHADTFNTPGGHLDVAPTLLSLLGISANRTAMLGTDLSVRTRGTVVFRDGSFIDDEFAFINRFGSLSAAGCFDLRRRSRTDCAALQSRREQTRERLEVSDLILRGDMIPELLTNAENANTAR